MLFGVHHFPFVGLSVEITSDLICSVRSLWTLKEVQVLKLLVQISWFWGFWNWFEVGVVKKVWERTDERGEKEEGGRWRLDEEKSELAFSSYANKKITNAKKNITSQHSVRHVSFFVTKGHI